MKIVISFMVLLGISGLAGFATAHEHDENPAATQKAIQAEAGLSCLCVQVCRITRKNGWSQRQPLPPGCAPLNDEVLYDNMANCSCPQPPAAGDPTSPNH